MQPLYRCFQTRLMYGYEYPYAPKLVNNNDQISNCSSHFNSYSRQPSSSTSSSCFPYKPAVQSMEEYNFRDGGGPMRSRIRPSGDSYDFPPPPPSKSAVYDLPIKEYDLPPMRDYRHTALPSYSNEPSHCRPAHYWEPTEMEKETTNSKQPNRPPSNKVYSYTSNDQNASWYNHEQRNYSNDSGYHTMGNWSDSRTICNPGAQQQPARVVPNSQKPLQKTHPPLVQQYERKKEDMPPPMNIGQASQALAVPQVAKTKLQWRAEQPEEHDSMVFHEGLKKVVKTAKDNQRLVRINSESNNDITVSQRVFTGTRLFSVPLDKMPSITQSLPFNSDVLYDVFGKLITDPVEMERTSGLRFMLSENGANQVCEFYNSDGVTLCSLNIGADYKVVGIYRKGTLQVINISPCSEEYKKIHRIYFVLCEKEIKKMATTLIVGK